MGHNESQGNVYIELVNEEQGWNRGLKCDESGCDYGLHLKIMGGSHCCEKVFRTRA